MLRTCLLWQHCPTEYTLIKLSSDCYYINSFQTLSYVSVSANFSTGDLFVLQYIYECKLSLTLIILYTLGRNDISRSWYIRLLIPISTWMMIRGKWCMWRDTQARAVQFGIVENLKLVSRLPLMRNAIHIYIYTVLYIYAFAAIYWYSRPTPIKAQIHWNLIKYRSNQFIAQGD